MSHVLRHLSALLSLDPSGVCVVSIDAGMQELGENVPPLLGLRVEYGTA